MENNDANNLIGNLEALLFTYGEPLPVQRIAKMLALPMESTEGLIRNLAEQYKNEKRAFLLIEHDGKVQLGTKAEFGPMLESLVKAELQEELTPAALETLSIVAYAGPLLRSSLDYIRGVNSSFILRALLIRGLIDRSLDADHGNAYRYAVSSDFLKHVGFAGVEDLPDYERFRKIMNEFQQTPVA